MSEQIIRMSEYIPKMSDLLMGSSPTAGTIFKVSKFVFGYLFFIENSLFIFQLNIDKDVVFLHKIGKRNLADSFLVP